MQFKRVLKLKLVFSFLLSATLISCSNKTSKTEDIKIKQAKVISESEITNLRPTTVLNLDNGLKIYFIEDKSLPRVSLHLLVKVGSLQEEKPGLNSLTADMLETGTTKLSNNEIADQLGMLGSDLSISPSYDYTYITLDALSDSSENLLNIFSDIVLHPAFKDKELARTQKRYIDTLKRKMDNPDRIADDAISNMLYQNHAYGRDLIGDIKSISNIKKKDIIKHYLTYYRPNNSSLAVVGNFDSTFKQNVLSIFNDWQKKNIKSYSTQKIEITEGNSLKLLSKKGLAQSQIRISSLGIQRSNPDYLPLKIANEVLGSGFVSRLNSKVRVESGLTYSIYSSIEARKENGPFIISTFTKNESVEKTIDETLNVFKTFVEGGINDDELQAAKVLLIGQFPKGIETADRYAMNIMILDYYNVPSNYLTNYNYLVRRITLQQVNEAIKKTFNPNNLKILVYSDANVMNGQLKKYNPIIEKVK